MGLLVLYFADLCHWLTRRHLENSYQKAQVVAFSLHASVLFRAKAYSGRG